MTPERAARWAAAGLLAVAVAHAVTVGTHYFVGSFDDDASYIIVARALAHGHGLTSTLPPGYPLAGTYPPGYSALLAPIARIDGSAFLAFRVLSVAFLVALWPLVWIYLGRRGLPDAGRVAVLALLAFSPVLATFSTMVMAELPFLVAFMVLLLVVERWEQEPGWVTWAGAATVADAAAMLWLKEAAAGLLIGLVVWLMVRRRWSKAVATAVGVGALFVPIVLARRQLGVSLLGARYAQEYGPAFQGQLVHQVLHAVSSYASLAIPQTIMPTSVSPLPSTGPIAAILGTLGSSASALVVIGFVVWAARHRDVTAVMIPVYLAETLAFPFVNERRLMLILPVVLAWYVLGAWAVIRAVRWCGAARWGRRGAAWASALAWAPAAVVAAILVPQFPRNYLYAVGQDTSRPQGSPYMSLLSRLGAPSDVVETDYLWTTNLFSGHRTANSAYDTASVTCDPDRLALGLLVDRPAYFLSGIFTNAGHVPSPCLFADIASSTVAVRLYRTAWDDAGIFEFIGPGTAHPRLVDLTSLAPVRGRGLSFDAPLPQADGDPVGTFPEAPAIDGAAVFTWDWGRVADVTQVTLGSATASDGPVERVDVELRRPDGSWAEVASAGGGVGPGGVVPYLLARLDGGVPASGLRVTVRGPGTLALLDVHALGSETGH